MLHKHCGLDKWQIRGYTYPQIIDLLHHTQNNIRFEIETRATPFSMFGGGGGESASSSTDDDYEEMTEEGFYALSSALGG